MAAEQTFVIVGGGMAGAKAAETLRERGLRRPRRADRRRARAPVRAPAALEGLPARRDRAREGVRARGGLLRASTTSTCARPRGVARRHRQPRGGARRRRDAALRPAAAGHGRRAAPAARSPAPSSTACTTSAPSPDSDRAARAARPRRLARRRGRGLDRLRGRRLRAPARPGGDGRRADVGAARARARARRSARSTATSTPTTACGCCSAPASRRFEGGTAVERVRTNDGRDARLRPRGRGHRRRAHGWSSPRRPGSRSATACSSTSCCRRAPRACSRPATWPPHSTPSTASGSAWSTGPTRSSRGPAAARNMLGAGDALRPLPYFFSDQYDVGMEYAGYATSWDRVVVRGDPGGREFIAFWMRGRPRRWPA